MRRGSAPPSDEVGQPVRQRVGLARAGAGDDQKRPSHPAVTVQDRRALGQVEPREVGWFSQRFFDERHRRI